MEVHASGAPKSRYGVARVKRVAEARSAGRCEARMCAWPLLGRRCRCRRAARRCGRGEPWQGEYRCSASVAQCGGETNTNFPNTVQNLSRCPAGLPKYREHFATTSTPPLEVEVGKGVKWLKRVGIRRASSGHRASRTRGTVREIGTSEEGGRSRGQQRLHHSLWTHRAHCDMDRDLCARPYRRLHVSRLLDLADG